MSYKIQDLDSDLNIAKMASIQGKHKTQSGDQNSEVPELDPITATMEAFEDRASDVAAASDDENCPLNKMRKKQAKESIGEILAIIASLTNQMQQKQAQFASEKSTLSNQIGQAAISSAQTAATNLTNELKKKATASFWEKFVKVVSYVVEAASFLFACATGNFLLAGVMLGLFIAQASGATNDLQTAIKKDLVKDGMSSTAASWLSAGIVCVIEIAVTMGASLGASLASAGSQVARTASQAAVKEVVTELAEDAMKTAAKTAVKQAVEDGVTDGADLAKIAVKAAVKAAKEALVAAGKEFGSGAVESVAKSVVKKVLTQLVKEITKEVSSEVGEAAAAACKTAMKQAVKTVTKEVCDEVSTQLTGVVKKAFKELSDDLKDTLRSTMKKIVKKQRFGACLTTFASAASSTGVPRLLAQQIIMAIYKSEYDKCKTQAQKDAFMEKHEGLMLAFEILSSVCLMGAGAKGMQFLTGSGSNFSGFYEDMGNDAEEIDRGIYQQVRGAIASLMRNLVSAPAKAYSLAANITSGADIATGVGNAVVSFEMASIQKQMAVDQPSMQENDAIVTQMNARKAADQKFLEMMYKMFPEMLASANSIATEIGTDARALSS